jgi:Ca-activated chloride channel family protein
MAHLQFAQPLWLWIGALCCAAAVVLLARAGRLRRQAVTALAGSRSISTVSRGRRLAKQVLVLTGLAATFVALARPLAGFRWEEERRDGIDLMFAVDTSKSMLATDLRPDRLTRAKLAVSDLLRKFPGERVGLIAFAGEAFVQAPMTIDHAVFGEALDALDTSIIPRGGTDIATPIRAAVEAMASEPDRRKLLVILSDGEDLQGEALAAAKEAARAGVVIYTVGVGTRSGDLIPVEHDGQRELLRDADGHFVTSHLDEQMLRQLAAITGGAYAPLGSSGQGLETLYRQHLAQLPRRTVEERMHKVYTERFQIPLGVAIGCLLLELGLGERRGRGAGRTSRRPLKSALQRSTPGDARSGRAMGSVAKRAAATALILMMVGASRPAAAAAARPSPAAVGTTTAVSTYNDGTAAYRKKDFTAARDRFQDATHTTDLSMQEDAYYDLGNARYRLGQTSVSKDRPATIEAWKSAVASYDGALALQPRDADARFNRDLVARRLAALEEQERQDQQQKNEQGQKDQKDQKHGSGKQAQASSGQGQQAEGKGQSSPQNGNGQPQQGQGSPSGQRSSGKSPSAPQAGNGQAQTGGQNQGGQPKQDHARNQTGPQERGGQKTAENGEPMKDGLHQGSGEQAGPQGDQKSGANQGPAPAAHADDNQGNQDQNATPKGPGVVSGQPGQSGGKEQPAGARRDPGALTPSEAVQLLDSVSGELHRVPVADARRRQSTNSDEPPLKDW